MKPAATDICLVVAGVGQISLHNSAKVLNQLRVRIGKLPEPVFSKPPVATSEAIREIGWENDRQFAGTCD